MKCGLNKFILCDMSAIEQAHSQVCLQKLLAVKYCIFRIEQTDGFMGINVTAIGQLCP